MQTFNVGDQVRILPPHGLVFSGVYPIIALAAAADTYTVDIRGDGIGSDYYAEFLEAA